MDSIVVPLLSRRRQRALTMQKVQHAAPAAALLLQGLSTLGRAPHGLELLLGTVEIVASALLIVMVARALRKARRVGAATETAHVEHAHGVDWIDICVAAVLAVEAFERWHQTHHIARPTIFTAVGMLLLGIFHGRLFGSIQQRRSLRAGDEGLYISTRPFRRFRAAWDDIQSIDIGERWASVKTRSGREQRLDLADLENAGPVRRALEVARTRIAHANRERD
jgi:hypothetical protein